MVVEDRVDLAGDNLDVHPPQQRSSMVAAIGKKAWRTRCGRPFADRGRLREHSLRGDLMAPALVFVDAPARRRQGEPVHGPRPSSPKTADSAHLPGHLRPEIN